MISSNKVIAENIIKEAKEQFVVSHQLSLSLLEKVSSEQLKQLDNKTLATYYFLYAKCLYSINKFTKAKETIYNALTTLKKLMR